MNYINQAKLNKLEIDKQRPLSGENLVQFREFNRVGLTYTSNAIEGNTFTESETKILLEDGLTVSGRPLKDYYETLGHSKAYDYMFSLIKSDKIKIDDIKTMHQIFYYNIDEKGAGKWRENNIIVTGSDYVFPDFHDIDDEMINLESWISNNRHSCSPIEFAAQLHLKFIFIHPFVDGNGRTARLLMNLSLIQDGYDLAIIPPICRHDYISCLQQAGNGNIKPFIDFIAERIVENQQDMMRLLHIKPPKNISYER